MLKIVRCAAIAAGAFFLSAPALAHGDEIHKGDSIMSMWRFESEIVAGLLIAGALYIAGIRGSVKRKAWRHAVFFAGLLALALALLSPIEPLADHVFAIHQIEHMLLRTIGPMLILLAQPQAALMRGMPAWLRRGMLGPMVTSRIVRSVFGFLSRPLVATLLFVGITWFWMLPHWHDVAILDERIHYMWHVSLLVSGLFFFSTIFDPRSEPAGPTLAVRLAMFWAAAMGNILLGAFLSFKTAPLYHAYDVMGRFWLDPVSDERVGGLIMWIPGCMMFAVSILLIVHRWGTEENRNEERRKRLGTAAAHSAAAIANRERANRGVAIGLASFAMLVLLIALSTGVIYQHEIGVHAVALVR